MTAIPTLPALDTAVAHELSRLHVSGRRIGEIVSDDPAMAVQLLGLETIRGLVLSTHVFETFRRPARGADLVQDARTAGLLHDVGKLLLVATLPRTAVGAVVRGRRQRAGQRAAAAPRRRPRPSR